MLASLKLAIDSRKRRKERRSDDALVHGRNKIASACPRDLTLILEVVFGIVNSSFVIAMPE